MKADIIYWFRDENNQLTQSNPITVFILGTCSDRHGVPSLIVSTESAGLTFPIPVKDILTCKLK